MQIKMKYHIPPVRMANIFKKRVTNVEEEEHLYSAGGNGNIVEIS